ncbi:Methyltransferase domain-containing protein [Sporobacter termitidis DSM 10068]|uniref:Methyltransferase domain-containing protein n=1 Tax=Sporobacter termitidis DSM 10068 TaxID=1123282 RepID=A0A1M5YE09_9FIRM|nr:class I SAM-dependent methyltransferase [Sporobacter termitidis]SHI10267.1 Methyltransferase domain-containing protein [Sporobacter termitidis DSM 10068]
MNEAENRSGIRTGRQSLKPVYDLWLEKYGDVLEASRRQPVLDLGCGHGNDSLYLTERGFQVVSCDISEEAIAVLRAEVPAARGMVADMRDGLPFDDGGFRVVIADLCLHYFSWADTVRIVGDIGRVLQSGGVLLCRLNSVSDVHYGAGQGERLEENFYRIGGTEKRFFDQPQIDALFAGWEKLHVGEYRMDRYKKPKMLWEVAAKKPERGEGGIL